MSSKDSSRTTAKRETISPKPPKRKKEALSRAKEALQDSRLAEKKLQLPKKKKKPSRAAGLLLSAAIAAGGATASPDALAKSLGPSLSPPSSAYVYDIKSPSLEASEESIRYLLHSQEAETEKYRISPSLNTFEVPLADGAKLRVSMGVKGKTLSFTVSKPGAPTRSFKIDFSDLDLTNPKVRIGTQGESLAINLLDQMGGRHARFNFRTATLTGLNPENMTSRVFDESAEMIAARYLFQALNTLPEPALDPNKIESRIFLKGFRKAESLLLRRIDQTEFSASSPEDRRMAYERTMDTFVDLYASIGGDAIEVISSEMKKMGREERKQVLEFVLPRIIALLLRPFAAWDTPKALKELDELFSSPDFNLNSIRNFAWHNGLTNEYDELYANIRKDLSSP